MHWKSNTLYGDGLDMVMGFMVTLPGAEDLIIKCIRDSAI